MNLRKLGMSDAPLMLEWMHDKDVVTELNSNFEEKTLDDCKAFIAYSQDTTSDLHMAVVDEEDTYMGTVSLKHIDHVNKNAEFAITIRKAAMGKGFSRYGMAEILRIGTEELGLENIFWCVALSNKRAVRFYDKNGYQRITDVPETMTSNYDQELLEKLIWYKFSK